MTKSRLFSRTVIHDSSGLVVEQVRADDVDAVQKMLTAIADQQDPSKLDRQTLSEHDKLPHRM